MVQSEKCCKMILESAIFSFLFHRAQHSFQIRYLVVVAADATTAKVLWRSVEPVQPAFFTRFHVLARLSRLILLHPFNLLKSYCFCLRLSSHPSDFQVFGVLLKQ